MTKENDFWEEEQERQAEPDYCLTCMKLAAEWFWDSLIDFLRAKIKERKNR